MKNLIIALLLSLPCTNGFSQNSMYAYEGRLNPSVKKEKLNEASSILDIAPGLWQHLVLPYRERMELEKRRKADYALGYCIYPHGGYNVITDYVSVAISVSCNGQVLTSQSIGDKLTSEQKIMLNNADLGSDIGITIRFRYKNRRTNKPAGMNRIIAGESTVTVVPEAEAEFPGGFKQITAYLTENFFHKMVKAGAPEKIRKAIVKFAVNEDGRIVDAKISRTSTDPAIDKLLLDTINKMPRWKPAENSKGIKVKQEFSIPLGVDGC